MQSTSTASSMTYSISNLYTRVIEGELIVPNQGSITVTEIPNKWLVADYKIELDKIDPSEDFNVAKFNVIVNRFFALKGLQCKVTKGFNSWPDALGNKPINSALSENSMTLSIPVCAGFIKIRIPDAIDHFFGDWVDDMICAGMSDFTLRTGNRFSIDSHSTEQNFEKINSSNFFTALLSYEGLPSSLELQMEPCDVAPHIALRDGKLIITAMQDMRFKLVKTEVVNPRRSSASSISVASEKR